MSFFDRQKCVCLSILGLLIIAVLFLGNRATLAFASAVQTENWPTSAMVLEPLNKALQQNNQTSQRASSDQTDISYEGANQGNSGNQGTNRGNNQDNNANAGNQVLTQRKHLNSQENNQSLQRTSNDQTNITYAGTNQGNSGNQGINLGNNQDNAGNSGNQVNNQGSVIGTQINNQGSEVNNDPDTTIHNQVNYVNLIPSLQFNLIPGQPVSVGVEKGWYLRIPLRLR